MNPQSNGTTLAIIGGGGFRTPRLLSGLLRHHEELALRSIRLYDPDTQRAEVMETLGRHLVSLTPTAPTEIRAVAGLTDAVRDAHFVLLTVRPGGEDGRVLDERACFAEDLLGQETVGPGGFFLAMRTIPVVLDILRAVRAVNPSAWVINFANPVGLVGEAVAATGDTRFVGVCDTPHHLVEELAQYLRVPAGDLRVESVGLNHLGWFQRVWHEGQDVLPRLLAELPAVQARIRPLSFFAPDDIRAAGSLPTEYVYLYQHPDAVRQRIVQGGQTRGEAVRDRSAAFYAEAARLVRDREPGPLWSLYLETLVGRSNSYLQQETAAPVARRLTSDSILATEGYERVALDAMLGLRDRRPHLAIVNAPSQGVAHPVLDRAAIFEGTMAIDQNGVTPLALSEPPRPAVGALMQRVKRYEQAAVAAIQGQQEEALVDALALSPLVRNRDQAARVLARRGLPLRTSSSAGP